MCATGSKIRAKNKTMRGGGREVLNFVREKKNYIFFTHLKSGSVFESTDPVLGPRFLLALRLSSPVSRRAGRVRCVVRVCYRRTSLRKAC